MFDPWSQNRVLTQHFSDNATGDNWLAVTQCINYFFFFFFFGGLHLFAPTGHSTLLLYFRCRRCIRNPAPGCMRYSYIFIAVLREFYCRSVQAYKAFNSCGEGLLITSWESGLTPLYIVCTP